MTDRFLFDIVIGQKPVLRLKAIAKVNKSFLRLQGEQTFRLRVFFQVR